MDNDALVRRLMTTFVTELEDHLQAFDRDLLVLESRVGVHPDDDLMAQLFRTAHTLKGAARAVDQEVVAEAAHTMETALAAMREGGRTVEQADVQALFDEVDRLRSVYESLRPVPSQVAIQADPVRTPFAPALASGEIRLPAERIDRMVTLSSQLLIARERGERFAEELASIADTVSRWEARGTRSGAARDVAQLERVRWLRQRLAALNAVAVADRRVLEQAAALLEAEVLRLRMLPFANVCEGFYRAVRDLARDTDKSVELIVRGGDVELDRALAEPVRDALLHVIRNAVAHGIEPPRQRLAASKRAVGRITLTAVNEGTRVVLEVADDGAGIDVDALVARAQALGLTVPDEPAARLRLVFAAGLSTVTEVSPLAGRGVGLDAARVLVEAHRGSIDVDSEPDRGTRFELRLPQSLSTAHALLVELGSTVYALDVNDIEALRRFQHDELLIADGRDALLHQGSPVPVVPLADMLGLPGAAPRSDGDSVQAAILADGQGRAAFVVDRWLGEQTVIVRDLGRRLRHVRGVSGSTLLADGRIVLVLRAGELLDLARKVRPRTSLRESKREKAVTRKRLLVADDSVTTRTLVAGILEGAGYLVSTAADGLAAWQLLQTNGADLVISDVDMPRLDGFALTKNIRASPRLRHVPVVLVTAHESEADRERGLAAGAEAYVRKSTFDQTELLNVVAGLL